MAKRANLPQCLLRLLGCCFALASTCLFSLPASAILVAYSGSFEDDGSIPDLDPDDFKVTNDPLSTEDIITVVYDLSTAAIGTTFDLGGPWAFAANGGDADATGFTGYVVTATTLTLTFTDFNAGEVFRFTIDVDDDSNVVEGASIAGSTVTATFTNFGDLVAVMADSGGDTADFSAVPEPGTWALLAAGLIGLAWGGRRRQPPAVRAAAPRSLWRRYGCPNAADEMRLVSKPRTASASAPAESKIARGFQ